jgi:hypothetical protein
VVLTASLCGFGSQYRGIFATVHGPDSSLHVMIQNWEKGGKSMHETNVYERILGDWVRRHAYVPLP